MDEKQVNVIKSNLDSKSSEELAEIWKNNNLAEFSPVGLEAVRRILVERNVTLPEQVPFTDSRREEAEKRISEIRIPLGFSGRSIVLLLGIGIFVLWVCVGDAIQDAIIPEPSAAGSGAAGQYALAKEMTRAGRMRVALDIIVVAIAGTLCLTSGIWRLVSKSKPELKGEHNSS